MNAAVNGNGQRNGYRERTWDTRVGTLDLKVPRARDGSYFPSLLEPRKRAERALVALVRVQGVSTRWVDVLIEVLGLDGISRSQVSRLCEGTINIGRTVSIKARERFLRRQADWLRANRHLDVREQQPHLRLALNGYYQYFGVRLAEQALYSV